MKQLLSIILIAFFLLFTTTQDVFAVEDPMSKPNNKVGIHILFPSELDEAARLVNSNGGDWGYVTIPIQSDDRNLDKWQQFMDQCKKDHLIPIIRIATYPQKDYWTKPTVFDPLDFANFLNSLYWPTKNHYIIIYNEPNHAQEWQQSVDAQSYAQTLDQSIDAFKKVSSDFFIISAGLDPYAPNVTDQHEASFRFLQGMDQAVPGIFKKIDGFSSHSYPANDFGADPSFGNGNGIATYRDEINFLQTKGRSNIPIFITETGWKRDHRSEDEIAKFYTYAFTNVWTEPNVIAVTPFVLNGQASAFSGFSFMNDNNQPTTYYKAIASLSKVKGQPTVGTEQSTYLAPAPKEVKKMIAGNEQDFSIQLSPMLHSLIKWFL